MKENIQTEKDLKHAINDMWASWPRKVPYVVEFYKKPEKRNIKQNNLYWKWISVVCVEWGYFNIKKYKTPVSNWLKEQIEYTETIEIKGETKTVPISTTTMNKKTMAKFMDKMQLYLATEENIIVPLPADKEFEKFCEYYEKFIK